MVDIYLFSISILGRRELNVKALLHTFNQEKALEGAFSVIVKTDGLFAALVSRMCSTFMCQVSLWHFAVLCTLAIEDY